MPLFEDLETIAQQGIAGERTVEQVEEAVRYALRRGNQLDRFIGQNLLGNIADDISMWISWKKDEAKMESAL